MKQKFVLACLIFMTIGLFLFYVHVAGMAEEKEKGAVSFSKLEKELACGTTTKVEHKKACLILKQFQKGKLPPETDRKTGARFINIGYAISEKGSIEKQLIVVYYKFSRDFHKKIYFPNKICVNSVIATEPGEEKVIQDAIQQLEKGLVPSGNPAYDWATQYDFSQGLCQSLEKADKLPLLRSEDGKWFLTTQKGAYLFVALGVASDDRPVLFSSK